MSSCDRKNWETPKLKVLARVRSEERVLRACKWFYDDGPDPTDVPHCIDLGQQCDAMFDS